MTTGRLVFLLLGLLGGLAILKTSMTLLDSHKTLMRGEQQRSLSLERAAWSDGTIALSLERSVSQVALSLEDPAPQAFLDLIAQQRAMAGGIKQQVTSNIGRLDGFENEQAFLDKESAANAEIDQLRAEVDAMLALPAAARDPARVRAVPEGLKSEIERLYAAGKLLALPEGEISSLERGLQEVLSLAWNMREYGGRARTLYAISALSGRGLDPEDLARAHTKTQRALDNWLFLQAELEGAQLPDTVMAQAQEVQRLFIDTYLPTVLSMEAAMRAAPSPAEAQIPVTFDEFFAMSNAALGAVEDLARVSSRAIEAKWDEAIAAKWTARLLDALLLGGVVLFTLAAGMVLRSKLTLRLGDTSRALAAIAEGDLDRDVPRHARDLHEVRVLADGVIDLRTRLRTARDTAFAQAEAERRAKEGIIGDLMIGLEKLALGDLGHRIGQGHGEMFQPLADNFNATCDSLEQAVRQVTANAGEIAQLSGELETMIRDLSTRTDSQSNSIRQTLSGLKEFAASLESTVENAVQSDAKVAQAADNARASGDVMRGAGEAMAQIQSSSDQINRFTTVIEEIAFQTGLLALNAGVEAARAGPAGKGFAVVATEIRSLAQRASEGAVEIKSVVGDSVAHVETGVEKVSHTGASLEEIINMVEDIRTRITGISQSSQVQNVELTEINKAMERLDEVTRQNNRMVEDVTTTSDRLSHNANALSAAVARFGSEARQDLAGDGSDSELGGQVDRQVDRQVA